MSKYTLSFDIETTGDTTMDYSISRLSHEVAAILRAPITEPNRFESMRICEDIANLADVTYCDNELGTLHRWIRDIQKRYQ